MKYNEKKFKVMIILAKLMKDNPQIKLEDLSEEDFKKMIEKMGLISENITEAENKLFAAEKERDEHFAKMNAFALRLKSLIVAIYGPDSPLLKQIGLVLKSERKKRKRGAGLKKAAEKTETQTVKPWYEGFYQWCKKSLERGIYFPFFLFRDKIVTVKL